MKKRKLLSFCVAAAMILTLGSGFASAESANEPVNYTIDTPYDYPVRPGMPEWAEFTDHQQMIDACEIPENILCVMSTEALVETVLDYPLLITLYAYEDFSEGFYVLANEFNGMQELLQRPDGAEVLMERYINPVLTPHSLFSKTEPNLVNGFSDSIHLGIILSQPEISEQLSSLSMKATQIKASPIVPEPIHGGDPIYGSWGTKTPRGTTVPLTRYTDMLDSDRTTLHNWVATVYPNAARLGQATYNYNCHSYAWYNQSTSNQYWMPVPSYYWQDGSYTQISASNKQNGDKLYMNGIYGDHSGVINGPNSNIGLTYIRSKWGYLGLYSHKVVDCPYYHTANTINIYRIS